MPALGKRSLKVFGFKSPTSFSLSPKACGGRCIVTFSLIRRTLDSIRRAGIRKLAPAIENATFKITEGVKFELLCFGTPNNPLSVKYNHAACISLKLMELPPQVGRKCPSKCITPSLGIISPSFACNSLTYPNNNFLNQ